MGAFLWDAVSSRFRYDNCPFFSKSEIRFCAALSQEKFDETNRLAFKAHEVEKSLSLLYLAMALAIECGVIESRMVPYSLPGITSCAPAQFETIIAFS